jgi:hypothetical protein
VIDLKKLLASLAWWVEDPEAADKIEEWGGNEETVLRQLLKETLHFARENGIDPDYLLRTAVQGFYFETDSSKREPLRELYDDLLEGRTVFRPIPQKH